MRLTSTDFVFNPDDFRDAKFIDAVSWKATS